MKSSDINIDTWESRAEEFAPPGILLSDRVSRKPRKPGLKTLPQRESRGRKSNCSLSWHHHHHHHHRRSSAENAAEIAIQVLGFIATREGADRWNFIKLETTPSSPETEGCQRTSRTTRKHLTSSRNANYTRMRCHHVNSHACYRHTIRHFAHAR